MNNDFIDDELYIVSIDSFNEMKILIQQKLEIDIDDPNFQFRLQFQECEFFLEKRIFSKYMENLILLKKHIDYMLCNLEKETTNEC